MVFHYGGIFCGEHSLIRTESATMNGEIGLRISFSSYFSGQSFYAIVQVHKSISFRLRNILRSTQNCRYLFDSISYSKSFYY